MSVDNFIVCSNFTLVFAYIIGSLLLKKSGQIGKSKFRDIHEPQLRTGISSFTSVPASAVLCTTREPPKSFARISIPLMPK